MSRRGPGAPRRAAPPWLILLAVALTIAVVAPLQAIAAPGQGAGALSPVRAVPGWMSDETARSLDLGFDILVPEEVPAPFAGEPAVTASPGAYSLYWLVSGGPPTFLEITGTVGGDIPDYSKYDRNVELTQNATVNGWPAYHDLTPIYDLVYWDAGGVVYSVESQNLAETDSLTLAESLAVLQQPDGNETEPPSGSLSVPETVPSNGSLTITIEGAGTLTADAGLFPATGSAVVEGVSDGAIDWQAPAVTDDTWLSFSLSDPNTGATIASASTLVTAKEQAADLALDCPAEVSGGQSVAVTISGAGSAIVDASGGLFPDASPNTDFGVVSDGETIQGSLADGGAMGLEWIAPDVTEAATYYLFASTLDGRTPGECAIVVQPAGDGAIEQAEVGAGTEAASGERVESDEIASNALPEVQEAKPTATSRSRRTTEKEPAYDEVIGLPTVESAEPSSTAATNAGQSAPAPTKSPAPRPTATLAPTIGQDGMVAMVVGPDGGSLANPAGAAVDLPAGALDREATLSIQPVADTKLPVVPAVSLIGGTGFDVALASADGRAITALKQPALIRIEVGAERLRDGARVYRVNGTSLEPIEPSEIDGTAVVARTTGFSRFVVGVPEPTTSEGGRNVLPFLLVAGGALLLLVGLVVIGSMFRPRRTRSVGVRRTPPRSRYR